MVLTTKDLDEAVEKLISYIDEKFSGINERITSLENSAQIHGQEFENQNIKIRDLQNENIDLKSQIDALSNKFEAFEQNRQTTSENTQLFNTAVQ